MSEQDPVKEKNDRHPLVTLGLLTAGTQIGSALIQRMGKHPVLLFGMGIATGIYAYQNRKEIVQEAQHLTDKTKKLISKKQ